MRARLRGSSPGPFFLHVTPIKMQVYHFTNRTYGLENIRRRRLKIATLDDINDPFELQAIELSAPDLRLAMREMRNEWARQFGILCFSRTWSNPVQWSHYAEKHRGLCLRFEVPDSTVQRVAYSSKRLFEDALQLLRDDANADATMLRLLSTKYSHWRYEQEVRAFLRLDEKDPERGLYFTEFSDKLNLTGVFVGAESTITRTELREALGAYADSVTQFKARLAFRTFKVVLQRDRNLWT